MASSRRTRQYYLEHPVHRTNWRFFQRIDQLVAVGVPEVKACELARAGRFWCDCGQPATGVALHHDYVLLCAACAAKAAWLAVTPLPPPPKSARSRRKLSPTQLRVLRAIEQGAALRVVHAHHWLVQGDEVEPVAQTTVSALVEKGWVQREGAEYRLIL